MENRYRKHMAVMVLCFLLGGFSIILYLLQLSALFEFDIVAGIVPGGVPPMPVFSRGFPQEEAVNPDLSRNLSSEENLSQRSNRRGFIHASPAALLVSPFSFILLLTGIISTSAGFTILNLVRHKEIRFAKKATRNMFLLPHERMVVDELESCGGEMTQSELAKRTGLSRVKVHRIVRNLESKGLVIKQEYGMTNKIVFKDGP